MLKPWLLLLVWQLRARSGAASCTKSRKGACIIPWPKSSSSTTSVPAISARARSARRACASASGAAAVNIIDGEELAHFLAFDQRLDVALLADGGEGGMADAFVLLRGDVPAQKRVHPRLRAEQAEKADMRGELADVAKDGEGAAALRFLAQEPAGYDAVFGGQPLHFEEGVSVKYNIAHDQHAQAGEAFHRLAEILHGKFPGQGVAKIPHPGRQVLEMVIEQPGRAENDGADVADFRPRAGRRGQVILEKIIFSGGCARIPCPGNRPAGEWLPGRRRRWKKGSPPRNPHRSGRPGCGRARPPCRRGGPGLC